MKKDYAVKAENIEARCGGEKKRIFEKEWGGGEIKNGEENK